MTLPTPTQEWFVGPGEDDNEVFGDWLRELRHTAGLTRAEAAAELKFSSEYIRLIERGKRTPASTNMRDICDTYEVVSQKLGINVWLVEDKTIVFTSRILESSRPGNGIEIPKVENRLETLGWIVDHLSGAEGLTLARVKKLLERDLYS
jgi:transcriptional regulator with XRE-family HTH domain